MEYYNNILCVTGSELITKRDDAGNIVKPGVIELHTYKNLVKAGHIVRHGYGGRGREVYIEFDTIARPDIKVLIREKLGDPKKQAEIKPFKDSIFPDANASLFFNNYIKEDGDKLTDRQKIEYCNDAAMLNAIRTIYERHQSARLARGASVQKFWMKALNAINQYRTDYKNNFEQEYPCTLPTSEKRLRMRYEAYCNGGYAELISGKIGNSNSEKISDDAKLWLLSKWANRISIVPGESEMLALYNKEAAVKGWKTVSNVGTIHNFLFREDIQELWFGHRYGELKAKEKFSYQHSTKLPSLRDSIWYSDGTKLNYFYTDENKKICTCQVYEVLDSYSEVLLGYHISKSEDYIAQWNAYKMAIQTSGHKPYEIKYDNQGGHKKLETGGFLNKLSRISLRTAPYNGKSKTIESVFGRFQQHYLKKEWYFTGQNITTKKLESKSNIEYILANKDKLPTLDEVKAIYKERREEWNNAPHHKTGIPRIEMYNNSHNDATPKVELWDMVDLFWITRKKPNTWNSGGISFIEKGVEYEYTVYNSARIPDIEWSRKNVDKEFFVKFDPDDMSLIYLYEQAHDGLRFVTAAETKTIPHRGKQEQVEGDVSFMKQVELENKKQRLATRNKMNEILEIHNLLPEQNGMNSPLLKGIEKKKKKKAKELDIAQYQKVLSNATVLADEDFDENDLYNQY